MLLLASKVYKTLPTKAKLSIIAFLEEDY